MYLAKDENGEVWLFEEKPTRNKFNNTWESQSGPDGATRVLPWMYNDVSDIIQWDNDPVEVDIVCI